MIFSWYEGVKSFSLGILTKAGQKEDENGLPINLVFFYCQCKIICGQIMCKPMKSSFLITFLYLVKSMSNHFMVWLYFSCSRMKLVVGRYVFVLSEKCVHFCDWSKSAETRCNTQHNIILCTCLWNLFVLCFVKHRIVVGGRFCRPAWISTIHQ